MAVDVVSGGNPALLRPRDAALRSGAGHGRQQLAGGLSGSFAEVWHGIENLLTGLSADERAAVLGGTAERIYRI
jgi:hypothetical protein